MLGSPSLIGENATKSKEKKLKNQKGGMHDQEPLANLTPMTYRPG